MSSVQTELVANAIPRAFGKCGPNDTKAFESWLLAEGKVCLPEIAAAYSKAISKIEEMSPRFGLAVCKLYGNLDVSDVAYQAGILSANTVFKAYNNRWCGRPLRALDCFVEYVRTGGGVACKPTALSTNAKKAPLDEGSVAASLLVHASAEATIAPTGQVAPVGSDSSDSNETYDRVARVVMDCFPNGARPGSIIDRNKIRRLYVERFNGSGLEDDEIIRALQARALIYNDKAYVLSDEAMECLRARCDEWVASGQRMFFYDELYRAYAEEFAEEKIFSSELLCTVLKLVEPHFVFYDAHFSVRRGITIEDELLRAFGDALVLSFEEIKVRLRFIPDDSLVPVLRRSVHFANAGQGDYVFLDNVTIDLQDASEAFRAVDEAIECNGFAPLRILDVERTRGENPGLSELGARNALYEKVLADSFDRKGSLLARHGERVSTRAVMCSWCLDHDGLSLNEMDDFVERELCNQGSAQLLRVAFDTMVRIEADKFVADGYVDFDVESVDAALALFVGDGIMPIKSITSFTSFPDVGRSWNLFLLGSYVHRFSARYQLGGEPVRGASVGAIYPKTVHFDGYVDLLARVLANSGVSLDDRTAGDYLVEQGFVARRAKITRDAATRARLLRG